MMRSREPRHGTRQLIPRVLLAIMLLPFLVGLEGEGRGACTPTLPPGVSTITVEAGNGFGGGTIYYPSEAVGPYGGISVVPAFAASQSNIRWYGPLLAVEGFVVFTIDTQTPTDDPASRGEQLLAALDYLTDQSAVQHIVDAERLGVMGWSMGGAGALLASLERPALETSVALAPWVNDTDFSAVTVPTLVVACELDSIAPIAEHAIPVYESLSPSLPKAYLEIAGEDHGCVTRENDTIGDMVVAWMRHFIGGT